MKKYTAIFLVIFFLLSCSAPDGMSGATEWDDSQLWETIAVEALSVEKGALIDDVRASGVVSGIREAFIVADTQGLVQAVEFNLGDYVQEGQELLRVDDRISALNLTQAREQLEAAKLELDSTEKLAAAGRSSVADLTRARGNASAAKAAYETALKVFEDTRLRSPISGVIASREPIATVGANLGRGNRVARVVDNSAFQITIAVGEREVGLLQRSAEAVVNIPAALGADEIIGSVTAIAAGSDPATGSYPVLVSFDNVFDDRVRSGMSATVSIKARQTETVIIIPSAALIRRGDVDAAFIIENDRAVVRELLLGRRSGVRVEVLDGLNAGDTLILSALTRLNPGLRLVSTVIGQSSNWE